MARQSLRLLRLVVGLTAVVLGFFCLNYTKGFDIDHHLVWATQHGLPKPTYPIFLIGVLLQVVGAGVVGHTLGNACSSGEKGSA